MSLGEFDAIVSASLSTGATLGVGFMVHRFVSLLKAQVEQVPFPVLIGMSPMTPTATFAVQAPAIQPSDAERHDFRLSHVADWMAEAPEVHPYRRELADAMREQLSTGGDVYLGPTDAEIAADALDGF